MKLTYPFLKVKDDKIIMFYPTGNHLKDEKHDDNPESSVYILDKNSINYFYYIPDKKKKSLREEFEFRYQNEAEPWTLCGDQRNGGNLAEIYHKMGEREKAIYFAKKAKVMGSDNPIISEILDGDKKAS